MKNALEILLGGLAERGIECLLVALKLHAMRNNPKCEPRDVADIVDLLRANPGTVAATELWELCEKYGPEGIRRKLEGYL